MLQYLLFIVLFLFIQPGYYGSKGASIITSTLVALFINKGILTIDHTKPQEPYEYVIHVLVPETASILISQDFDVSLENAREIMINSVEFGNYVHDVENDYNHS